MHRLLTRFMTMPLMLKAMLVVFALLPLWALSLPPASTVPHAAAARLVALWIGPWAVCLAILLQHAVFLPLFALESLALAYVMLESGGRAPSDWVGPLLLVIAFVVGLLTTRRDALMPFFHSRRRSWRRSERLFINAPVTLRRRDGRSARALMEDVSASGLAVSGDPQTLARLLEGATSDEVLTVELGPAGGHPPTSFAVNVRRVTKLDEAWQLGLTAGDADTMAAVMTHAAAKLGTAARLRAQWAGSAASRAAAGVWCLAMAGALGSPACGALDGAPRPTIDDRRTRGAAGAVQDLRNLTQRARLSLSVHGHRKVTKPQLGLSEASPAACDLTTELEASALDGVMSFTGPTTDVATTVRFAARRSETGALRLTEFTPQDSDRLADCLFGPGCAARLVAPSMLTYSRGGATATADVDPAASSVNYRVEGLDLEFAVVARTELVTERCVVVQTSDATAVVTANIATSATITALVTSTGAACRIRVSAAAAASPGAIDYSFTADPAACASEIETVTLTSHDPCAPSPIVLTARAPAATASLPALTECASDRTLVYDVLAALVGGQTGTGTFSLAVAYSTPPTFTTPPPGGAPASPAPAPSPSSTSCDTQTLSERCDEIRQCYRGGTAGVATTCDADLYTLYMECSSAYDAICESP